MNDGSRIVLVGPLPPPVHGQANVTKRILDDLNSQNLHVKMIDTSEGNYGAISRIFSHLIAAFIIARKSGAVVYLSVNARLGGMLSILLAALARIRRAKIVLHHHNYSYIRSRSSIIRVLAMAAGQNALHVTNCRYMSLELISQYPRVKATSEYSAIGCVSVVSQKNMTRLPDLKRPVVLGFMCNISKSKGIATLITAFQGVQTVHPHVSLIIGGPLSDRFSEVEVSNAINTFGSKIDYRGLLNESDKQRFFNDIDIFVYPTTDDSQGIVNLEALATGNPVVATSICCISSDLGDDGGVAVSTVSDFGSELIRFIDNFVKSPAEYSGRAIKRYRDLTLEHDVQKEKLRKVFTASGPWG